MTAPQIVYIALAVISLIGAGLSHGKPAGTVNFFHVLTTMVGLTALLVWGGFF